MTHETGSPPVSNGEDRSWSSTAGGRQFPCEKCGARVEFRPGTSALVCPYCGQETHIPSDADGVAERDFLEVTADLVDRVETEEVATVRCDSCGALIEPLATHEAFPCPYCAATIVARETSMRRIRPQALLPFAIDRAAAEKLFRKWIRGRRFAPNALKKLARVDGRLQGLYAPYWTYDAATDSRYSGERGDDYYVTRTRTVMRNGKAVQETYQEVRTRWRPAAGVVARAFDDVLVLGSKSLPGSMADALEPWDLGEVVTYREEFLSGFTAERYQVDVKQGWVQARERMAERIRDDVRRDIGGDRQRIHSLDTTHREVTFKHLLLPMWVCSYQYRKKVYHFLVNARTGEVQGQRPWSWVKIALLIVALVVVAFLIQATG